MFADPVDNDEVGKNMNAIFQAIHPVLQASNVEAMVRFYRNLGFAVVFQDAPTDPKYVGVSRDQVGLHIQWADSEQWAYPIDRPAYRFVVADVDAIYQEFVASGAVRSDPSQASSPWASPKDTPWGTREFHLRDPSQNSLQFYRPL
jgi:catechol 2,3-dioxygenase-like lactoylglutathione lyase family enzyme